MFIRGFNFTVKQIFHSNILLIFCCVFYLAWWLLAFHPTRAVGGMKTGWLLIPAFAAGLAAVILAVRGIRSVPDNTALFSGRLLLWGGIAAYFVLLAGTYFLLHRQVTTELFLIVGWAVLALSEINALFGVGCFPHNRAVLFAFVITAVALVSLICYARYYNLSNSAGYFSAYAGYIDGIIPLALIALVTAGVSIAIAV